MCEDTLEKRLYVDLCWGWIFLYVFYRIRPSEVVLSIPRHNMLWVFDVNPLALSPVMLVRALDRVSCKGLEDIYWYLWKTALSEDEKQRAFVNEALRITVHEIAKLPGIEEEWFVSEES
jgi:hypothetical protein